MSFSEWFNRQPPPWIVRVGDATSTGFNVVLFNGGANESVSGRAYRIAVFDNPDHKAWAWAYRNINRVFSFVQDDHCKDAYDADLAKAIKLKADHERRIAK